MGARSSDAGSETKDYELMEASQYPGRCIAVIELGTQKNTFPGATHPTKLDVILIYEISELMEDGRPFTVNLKLTNSLNEKAALRKHLESWRGSKFTKEEAKGFNLGKLLDKPALVNVTKTESKNEKWYNNIATITPLPEAMKPMLSDRINELVDFGIGDLDKEATTVNIWPWIRKIIEESEEGVTWKADGGKFPDYVPLQAPGKNPEEAKQDSPAGAAELPATEDDSIPF